MTTTTVPCHPHEMVRWATYSMAASETGILLRFKSSCSLWLSSLSLRSLSSAMLCFLLRPLSLVRISYGADMLYMRGRERVFALGGGCKGVARGEARVERESGEGPKSETAGALELEYCMDSVAVARSTGCWQR